MIRYFRDNIQGNVAKVFVILICIPFVLFGVESIFSTGSEPKVAKVDGESITERELETELQRTVNRVAQMQGENFDPSSIQPETFRPAALDNLVNRILMMQLAEDQDMAVSVKAADKAIVDLAAFHVDGKFDADMYKNVLRGSGHTPSSFKKIVSDDILVTQVNSAVASGMFVTDAEVNELIKLDFETRDLSYVTLQRSAVAANIVVSEDEAQQYYDDNTAAYMTDEKVAVDYIEIQLQDFFQPVDDADLQQAYQQHIADMVLPTQRQAAHILLEFSNDEERIAAETTLLEAKQRIEAGEEFGALAAELSVDQGSASDGGNLGYTSGELFPQAFEDALAALEVGQLSEPVETEAGLHLIKLLDIEISDMPSLEDLTPSLTTQLQRIQATGQFEQQLELLRDLSFDSDAISSIADELGVELENSGKFSAEGAISGLFAAPNLVSAAFSNEIKLDERISEVIEISPDQYVVMQLSEHEASEAKPFASVQASITQQLTEEKTTEALTEQAEQLVERLKAGEAMATLAEELELTVASFEGVSRREPGEAERAVINVAFATPLEGDIAVDQTSLRDNNIAVFVASNAIEGDVANVDDQQRESMKRLIQSLRGRAENTAFVQALNDRADIDIF